MTWPTLTDFSEAIQNPQLCFRGTDLEAGTVATNQRGLPLLFSGAFACVYSVSVGSEQFAVRCFTREVKDQQTRYNQLSDYLTNVVSPSFVSFEYLEHGISVKGTSYPVVKMEWVEGDLLSDFVRYHLDDPVALDRIAAQWRGTTVSNLRGLHIAHNDLQHGNVMVQGDGNIRLVDYDGMFLPQFRGEGSPELGHKNYQHPERSSHDYDSYVDNFPSLVIYLSIRAIASDSTLWSFHNDDNLIFTRNDYTDPESSEIFDRLKNSPDPDVAQLTKYLEECCALPVGRVPDLETALQDIQTGTAPSHSVPHPSITPGPTDTDAAGQGYRQILQEQQSSPSQPAAQPMTPSGQSTAVSQSTATVQIPQPNVVPGTGGRRLLIIALAIGSVVVLVGAVLFWWLVPGNAPPAPTATTPPSPPTLAARPSNPPPTPLAAPVALLGIGETPTPSPTVTPESTSTPVPTPTPYPVQSTYTPLPTSTLVPTPTPTPTSTPRPTPTLSPTSTPSPITILTSTPSPTASPVPIATLTATPMPTATNTPTPTHTPTPLPTATPTLTPTRVPILPDLVVGPVSAPSEAQAVWDEVVFIVSVSNQGTTSAGEFTVGLYDGNEIIDERTVGGLVSSTAKEVTLAWRAEAAPRPLSIVVDRDNRIAESDELNNFRPAPRVAAPPLTHVVNGVTWHPEKPEIGESVRFWARIENISGVREEHDVGVAFYIDGEYHSWSRLENDETATANQIASDSWEAQKGSHEVTAVLYPIGFFNYSSKSSWREFNHRYVVAIGRATYDHTRLPNLAVTDVEFSQENVAGTDTFYLDTRITVLNKIGDDGLRPPPVTNTFDVRIEFKASLPCPFGAVAPCEATLRINGLDRGAGVTRSVEGAVPLPLPRTGGVHEFRVVVTVDPLNVVDESDESDNITETTSRVTNN